MSSNMIKQFLNPCSPGWNGQCIKHIQSIGRGVSRSNMNPAYCIQTCKDNSEPYAALTLGSYCFCYNEEQMTDAIEKDQLHCNYKCSGDANQFCGGNLFDNVNEVNGEKLILL